MKIAKQKSSILAIFMMVLTIILAATSVNTYAAGKKGNKAKAVKAYKTYLTKVRKEHPDSKFALAYLDKDKVPELFVLYKNPLEKDGSHPLLLGTLNLYTFKGNKVKAIDVGNTFSGHGHWFYQKPTRGYLYSPKPTKLEYYKNTGIYRTFRCESIYDITDYYSMNRKLTKNGIDKPNRKVANYEKTNQEYNKHFTSEEIFKTINKKSVKTTKSAFNKYIKKITKGKKATTVKFVKNTAKNAKKKLK